MSMHLKACISFELTDRALSFSCDDKKLGDMKMIIYNIIMVSAPYSIPRFFILYLVAVYFKIHGHVHNTASP